MTYALALATNAPVTQLCASCEHLMCAASPQLASYSDVPTTQLPSAAHPVFVGVPSLFAMPAAASTSPARPLFLTSPFLFSLSLNGPARAVTPLKPISAA